MLNLSSLAFNACQLLKAQIPTRERQTPNCKRLREPANLYPVASVWYQPKPSPLIFLGAAPGDGSSLSGELSHKFQESIIVRDGEQIDYGRRHNETRLSGPRSDQCPRLRTPLLDKGAWSDPRKAKADGRLGGSNGCERSQGVQH
jgi:hypothetical protein